MISDDRKEELEKIASQILFNNDMYKIPVNLLKIAKNFDITVYNTNFEKWGKKYVSGVIRYVDGKISILINQKDSREMKRYTLAHELGHFFLDNEAVKLHKIHIDTLYRDGADSSKTEPKTENRLQVQFTDNLDIDYFASALLMDRKVLRKVFKVESSISELAKLFVVSYSVMAVRLDTLGLI